MFEVSSTQEMREPTIYDVKFCLYTKQRDLVATASSNCITIYEASRKAPFKFEPVQVAKKASGVSKLASIKTLVFVL